MFTKQALLKNLNIWRGKTKIGIGLLYDGEMFDLRLLIYQNEGKID